MAELRIMLIFILFIAQENIYTVNIRKKWIYVLIIFYESRFIEHQREHQYESIVEEEKYDFNKDFMSVTLRQLFSFSLKKIMSMPKIISIIIAKIFCQNR